MNALNEAKHFLFDLDGCIWFGRKLAPGAKAIVDGLKASGRKVVFLTNTSTRTGAELAGKLRSLGIHAEDDDVITPLTTLGRHPLFASGDARALVLGGETVERTLKDGGTGVVSDPDEATVVVVGNDPALTYEGLKRATWALLNGAALAALNLDRRVPAEDGRFNPGVGAIIAALREASDVQPVLVGKPSEFFFSEALRILGLPVQRTVMVGDSPDSDIAGGARVGLATVLVGNHIPAHASVLPDLRVSSLGDLLGYLPIERRMPASRVE